MIPPRRDEFAQDIGKAMRRFQARQQMHMISYPTDALRKSSKTANRSAQVIVQARAPGSFDARHSVFGAEYQMIMKAWVS